MTEFKHSTEEEVITAVKRVNKCRGNIVITQPFYGFLLTMMDMVPTEKYPHAATNGKVIYFNPKSVSNFTDDELTGVLMHEITHCIYLHVSPERRLSRDPKIWNYAIDYVTNYELKSMHYILPTWVLYSDEYGGKNAEQVYDILIKKRNGEGEGEGSGVEEEGAGFDSHIFESGIDWDDMADRVYTAYKMTSDMQEGHGHLPEGIENWIKNIKKSKIPWSRILHRYIGEALAKDDYSYSRCNRRFLSQEIYLPDLRSYKLGKAVLAVDTSGSTVYNEDLPMFAGEIQKISHLIDKITVITCDAAVHEVVDLFNFSEFFSKIKFLGGGGTDFRPVFEKLEDSPPNLLIYLTDGWGSYPEKAPDYPVIWCLTEGGSVESIPFGVVVKLPRAHD